MVELLMHFAFKWKHRDGAMVEFEPDGWSSDDPAKTAWLKIESGLSNPWPIIPAAIRLWLQQQCELIEFRGIIPECSEGKTEVRIICRRALKPRAEIQLGSYVEDEGKPLFNLTKEKGMDGIIADHP